MLTIECNYTGSSYNRDKTLAFYKPVCQSVARSENRKGELSMAIPLYPFRIGHGYDVHRLSAGRRLILGGVEIPYTMGLLGHSDADVLLHAVMDAVLGAMGLGDIGHHFPDTDPAYKDISSIKLSGHIAELLTSKSMRIVNADATILAQCPRPCSIHSANAHQSCPYLQRFRGRCKYQGYNRGAPRVYRTRRRYLSARRGSAAESEF